MVNKIGSIFYPEAISAYSYSTYLEGSIDSYVQILDITSSAKVYPPSYVLIVNGQAFNAVAKARTTLASASYVDYLLSKNLIFQVGIPASTLSSVKSVTIIKGTGKVVSLSRAVESSATAIFGAVLVKFNPVFNNLNVQVSTRGSGELDSKQRTITETQGGQEFNISLAVYSQLNGDIAEASPTKAEIISKNILERSSPKDRRNMIKSFVNHYSNAGKRI